MKKRIQVSDFSIPKNLKVLSANDINTFNKEKATYFIVLDTETNGLPKNFNANPKQHFKDFPRVVQLAYTIVSSTNLLLPKPSDFKGCHDMVYGDRILFVNEMVKPNDDETWTVGKSEDTHGFSDKFLQEKGDYIENVLYRFFANLKALSAKNRLILVCHNIAFDYRVLSAEFYRNGVNYIDHQRIFNAGVCTMEHSTNLLKLPGKFGNYKWPKLEELYRFLFNKEIEGAHDARVDVSATIDCLVALIKHDDYHKNLPNFLKKYRQMARFNDLTKDEQDAFISNKMTTGVDLLQENNEAKYVDEFTKLLTKYKALNLVVNKP